MGAGSPNSRGNINSKQGGEAEVGATAVLRAFSRVRGSLRGGLGSSEKAWSHPSPVISWCMTSWWVGWNLMKAPWCWVSAVTDMLVTQAQAAFTHCPVSCQLCQLHLQRVSQIRFPFPSPVFISVGWHEPRMGLQASPSPGPSTFGWMSQCTQVERYFHRNLSPKDSQIFN